MLDRDQALIFVDILSKIHQSNDAENIYKLIIEESVKALHVQAGTLFITSNETATLLPVSSVGTPLDKLKTMPFKFGLGICGAVAESGESLILNDAKQDKRFTDLYDRLTGFKTTSILCAPLVARGECIGVMELFNRTDRNFIPEDLVLLSMIGKHMAIALENAMLFEQLNRLNALTSGIVECLPAGFVSIDNGGIVTMSNRKAAEILGLDEAVIGKSYEAAFGRHPAFSAVLEICLKKSMAVTRQEFKIARNSKDLIIGYSTALIRNQAGTVVGRGMIFQNITNVKH